MCTFNAVSYFSTEKFTNLAWLTNQGAKISCPAERLASCGCANGGMAHPLATCWGATMSDKGGGR